MELSDRIKKVQCQDRGYKKAFESLVKEFKDRIFTVCYRMLNHYDDASEISQDTFVEVYLKLGSLQDPQKFHSWIYRIAFNKCLNFIKRNDYGISNNVDLGVSINQTRGIENKDTINFLLSQLTREYRIVLILFYIEERSIKEIAEILTLSESAVKMRLKRAKDKLKKITEIRK